MITLAFGPPNTPIEPVEELHHGVNVVDPYRWLEDSWSNRTRAWIREQTKYFRSVMDTLPNRERIQREVEAMLLIEQSSPPVQHGAYWFFTRQGVDDDQPSLYMRRSIDGPDILLVDPKKRGTEIHVQFKMFSHDGRLMAYYVKRGGDSLKELEIMNVETHTVLPDKLPLGYVRGFQFAPDQSGFYYVHQNPPNIAQTREVRFHRFGTEFSKDRILWSVPPNPAVRLSASFHADCSLALYRINIAEEHTRQEVYIHDLRASDSPKLLCAMEEHQQQFQLHNDRLIICTSIGSPNKRIEIASLESPDERKTIVPEREAVIQNFIVIAGRVFVSYIEKVSTRTLIYSLNGDLIGEVPYPSAGTGNILAKEHQEGGYCFHFESFTQPSAVYRVSTIGNPPKLVRITGRVRDFAVKRIWYPSRDNTLVHMYLVGKAETLRDASPKKPVPVFLTAYGSCGSAETPRFSETATFVVEHGGIFALANIRGGSEFGSHWAEAARGRKRQVAIDDFICAAEWLCSHYSTPRKLGIGGGSNSGTLVCAAMTQRPALFRVVFSLMPLLDMIRFPLAGHANFYVHDLGNPTLWEDFKALFAYSPYHRVIDGQVYPAVYFLGGDLDRRCDPLHPRKLTARLQHATTSSLPVVLDYIESWGHSRGRPRRQRIRSLTDRWAFLAHQIGLNFEQENQ